MAGDVDVSENTITLSNHGFNSGDKVIHTATTSSGGLVNESIYYIFRYSKDKVKLCNTEYEALKFNPKVVDITSELLQELYLKLIHQSMDTEEVY